MLNNKNTLVIVAPGGAYPTKLYENMAGKGYVTSRSMCGGSNLFMRIFRVISAKWNLPTIVFCYGAWYKKDLSKYENILIIFDKYSFRVIEALQKKKKYNGTIYLDYMDPISTKGAFYYGKQNFVQNEHFKIYSFEKKDCDTYGFKYNSLFFFKEDIKSKNTDYWSDVFFIGTDKNRLEPVLKIVHDLEKRGLIVDVHMCKFGKRASAYGRKIGYHYKTKISYQELLEKLYHSKCLLDVAPERQTEVTLRVFEALFCKKKVITNNKNIKNYGFYDSDNIFIYGERNLEEFKDFLEKPFNEQFISEIQYYEFEEWMRRFQ